jgi:hypothetical protein
MARQTANFFMLAFHKRLAPLTKPLAITGLDQFNQLGVADEEADEASHWAGGL